MWIIGVALIGLVAVDVFLTVFHPHARSGPLSRFVVRAVWWSLGWSRRLTEPRRDRVMALIGPLIAVKTLATWGLLLLLGFALVYASALEHLVFTEVRTAAWIEALYFSGTMLSTLGLGDVVPGAAGVRLIAMAQAISGFILLSVGVSYLLAVYQSYRQAAGLALGIHGVLGDDRAAGVRRLLRNLGAIGAWAERVAQELNALTSSSTQYPILQYFRPPDRRRAPLVQAGALLDLFDALDRGATIGYHEDEHPSLHGLRSAVHAYLEEVARFFRIDTETLPEVPDERARARHERLLEELGYRTGRS